MLSLLRWRYQTNGLRQKQREASVLKNRSAGFYTIIQIICWSRLRSIRTHIRTEVTQKLHSLLELVLDSSGAKCFCSEFESHFELSNGPAFALWRLREFVRRDTDIASISSRSGKDGNTSYPAHSAPKASVRSTYNVPFDTSTSNELYIRMTQSHYTSFCCWSSLNQKSIDGRMIRSLSDWDLQLVSNKQN